MKTYFRCPLYYLCLLGLTFFYVLVANAANKQVLKISSSESPPYMSDFVTDKGYANHVIQCAFSQQQLKIKFVFMPTARAYKEAMEGKFAASSYWYLDAKHEESFLISEPITREKIVFFRRKSPVKSQWTDLSDFARLRIGMTRGYTYTKALRDYAQTHESAVSFVTTDQQNMKMLLLERIDIFPIDEASGWYLLNQFFATEQIHLIETIQPPLMNTTGHLLFPKVFPNAANLLQTFNKGLAQCAEQGKLQQYKDNLVTGHYRQIIK
jgi:polar amino acid transport system substrate-binding protein